MPYSLPITPPRLSVQVHATTAQFPGLPLHACLEQLHAGTEEPALGAVSTAHLQLCPQTPGELDEVTVEALRTAYPRTQFRTHANARVHSRLAIHDLSSRDASSVAFFHDLADRNRRLGARVISLHAGYRAQSSLDEMLDFRARLQDEVFGDATTVAIEGLYPNARRPQLVDTWSDYERLLRENVPLAVDLSHLAIVAAREGTQCHDLVRALCGQAAEIHLSTNDERRDTHDRMTRVPWWWSLLCSTPLRTDCVVFTEGRQPDPFRQPLTQEAA